MSHGSFKKATRIVRISIDLNYNGISPSIPHSPNFILTRFLNLQIKFWKLKRQLYY